MDSTQIRTTVAVPRELLGEVDNLIDQGRVKSRNSFIVKALESELKRLRSEEIDRAFAEMATDEEFKKESLMIAAEFSSADWEALRSELPKP